MSENSNKWGIPYLEGSQIRQSFIDFFVQRGHTIVPSSPVVPHDDPTLLFINSGMNQFKSLFLGDNRLGLKRAVNSQKCLRVSGKHNDLDEVGRDTYHHTFFEMLGNWSFGDYYKREAITWSWQLLTEVWKLPKNRLFATIFTDDDEAEKIWREHTDINPNHIMRFGEKSNFWEMGDVGPCGPCTEIHFDMGDLSTQAQTFNDPVLGVNGTNARYIEIWNNVFMQYERLSTGKLLPLKAKHVDTGMGFERICSIIQGTGSNYETDVFRPLLDQIARLTGHPYHADVRGTPHRVVADHLRALTFAIADGATPGNEGRGYVLRRILRRASRFSQQLDQRDPFIFKLVPTLIEIMGSAYPEIEQRQAYISQVIQAEETRFMKTLRDGLARFAKVASEVRAAKKDTIPGLDVFLLYDTYGFPADLTGILAEENGLKIDHDGFASAMSEQRERARSATKFDASLAVDEGWTILTPGIETKFCGYESLTCESSVTRFREVGDDILVCLDKSPFYAESGGQVGDIGFIEGQGLTLKVLDTVKVLEMQVHKCALVNGLLEGKALKKVTCRVDQDARSATMRNHSATHLLHQALKDVLGPHVAQQGSRVSPEALRFDFTHPQALSGAELALVERMVNNHILANVPVVIGESSISEAKAQGAVALFGEKYGERVRHVRMADFSHELCGGTHTQATGNIGMFRVTGESSIAAGIRRIEAVTGLVALELSRRQSEILSQLGRSLKVKADEIESKVVDLTERLRDAEKELRHLQHEQIQANIDTLLQGDVMWHNGVRCIVKKLDPARFPKSSHQAVLDAVAGKLARGIAFFTHVEDGTLSLLAAVGVDLREKLKAGDFIKELSKIAEGRGGGRADKAQAGSKFPEKEEEVLKAARELMSKGVEVL